ncbi:MAG: hypothetical protein KJ574_00505 [Nanoarchaeota archaeon]|nr:hypothetical protein [Nanoarchaeota archaeon]
MTDVDSTKNRIDEIAPEVFKLQDLRRDNKINAEQKKRLEELEREYYELMGKLADSTIEMLKKEGVLK